MADTFNQGYQHLRSLRERVLRDVEPFVDALDQAVTNPAPEVIEDLREAADHLMRAVAAVMLELGKSKDVIGP